MPCLPCRIPSPVPVHGQKECLHNKRREFSYTRHGDVLGGCSPGLLAPLQKLHLARADVVEAASHGNFAAVGHGGDGGAVGEHRLDAADDVVLGRAVDCGRFAPEAEKGQEPSRTGQETAAGREDNKGS